MTTDSKSAMEIAMDVLAETAKALMDSDFDAFADRLVLPVTIITPEDKFVIETQAESQAVFDKVLRSYRRANITSLDRTCLAAEFDGPDMIKTTHETRLISGTTLVEEPFPVFCELVLRDGKWRVQKNEYAFPSTAKVINRAFSNIGGDRKA